MKMGKITSSFFLDVPCQKLSKSTNVSRNYSKIKVFLEHSVTMRWAIL